MRALVQRVKRASVTVGGERISEIGEGLLVLLGVSVRDTGPDADKLARKVAGLRIFPDDAGVMNRSVVEHSGVVLAVSQFTLYGDTRKGNRPSYIEAAPGPVAEPLYERFCAGLREAGLDVRQGVFGADMDVELTNWGPVSLLLASSANLH